MARMQPTDAQPTDAQFIEEQSVEEQWAVVPLLESKYEINSQGTVLRCCRAERRRKVGDCVPMRINRDGYLSVQLMNKALMSVHRLVLFSFVGAPSKDKPFGLHIDGNKLNNCVDNLRWGSAKERVESARRRGSYAHRYKLTEAQVTEIRRLLKTTDIKYPALSAMFGVAPSTLCDIKMRKSWAHL